MNVDLHAHSTSSDGLLSPRELVERAARNGVTTLALTDHDEVAGLVEARTAANHKGLCLVDGVEISVTWRDATIHVLGLKVDPTDPTLLAGLFELRSGRLARAKKIAEQLEVLGIQGSLGGALALAGNPNIVSRAHFARYLVEKRFAPNTGAVFQRYLARGKPGYVAHQWVSLSQAIAWIRGSGGIAVLAHPGRYALSEGDLTELLTEFKECGGESIEVVSGSHTKQQTRKFTAVANTYGFLASRGSDFHAPGERRGVDLGGVPMLADSLSPVWTHQALHSLCI